MKLLSHTHHTGVSVSVSDKSTLVAVNYNNKTFLSDVWSPSALPLSILFRFLKTFFPPKFYNHPPGIAHLTRISSCPVCGHLHTPSSFFSEHYDLFRAARGDVCCTARRTGCGAGRDRAASQAARAHTHLHIAPCRASIALRSALCRGPNQLRSHLSRPPSTCLPSQVYGEVNRRKGRPSVTPTSRLGQVSR